MFSCESRATLTVSGRTRAVQESKFTLGQDLTLAKQSRKHFVVGKSNGRNYWALSTSCSGSFETDLFTLSLKHLTWTDRTYTRSTRVRTIPAFSSFVLIFVFVIHSATEDCKVVLLPLFVSGPRFPIMRIQDRNDFGYHAVHWSA